jgi:hypothetical protein
MQEFKKLTVIFGVGLAGVAVALVGTVVTAFQQKEVARQEAQQIQAVPADSQSSVPAGVPAQ